MKFRVKTVTQTVDNAFILFVSSASVTHSHSNARVL